MFGDNQALEEDSIGVSDYLFPPTYDIFHHEMIGDEKVSDEIQEIATKCSREGKLSELIKFELKTKIQLQKHKNGQSFDVEWRQPEGDTQLTPESLERRKEQRERNKLAARKHRIKKKEEKAQVKKETIRLQQENACLQQTVKELESLRNKIYEGLGFFVKEEAV